MFPYSVTERVERCTARIDELRERIDATGPLPRIWRGRTRRDLEAESIAASTIMEGVAVKVDEARRILAGDRPAGVSSQDADLVDGYRDAMQLVLSRADATGFRWQSELIVAIHHAAMGGSFAKGAGRYRENQNWLTNRQSGAQIFLPPPWEGVPALVDELAGWLENSSEHAAVNAAVAHVRLAAIHPFRDGNGRTARILASLATYRGGFRAPQFTSLEEWWGRHIAEYYEAFSCLGSKWDPEADVTPFVEAHVSAQTAQVEALSLRNSLERAVWTVLEDIAVHDLGLHERTTNALYDAFFARTLTNRYYRNVSDVSDVTASHDLSKLVASGLLDARGAGRSAHYVGTAQLARRFVEAAELDTRWLAQGGSLEDMRDLALTGLAQRMQQS